MSDRLDNERIEYIERRCDNEGFSLMAKDAVALAREVLASRKLIADLRAEHRPITTTERGAYNEPYEVTRCRACGWSNHDVPDCPTIRLIDKAGL